MKGFYHILGMAAILDLAINQLMKDVIVILETTKYEADQIKIEDAGVATTQKIYIFQTFKGSMIKFELIQDAMVILVTSKYEEDPIKIEGARVATIQNIDFQTLKLRSQSSDLAEIRTHPRYYSYPCYLQE